MPLLSLLTCWPVNIALNVGSSLHCAGYTPSVYSPQQPHMPLLAQLVFHEAQPSLCDYRQLYFSSIQECDFKSAQIFLRVLCKPEVESIVIPAGWAATPMEVLNIMADSGSGWCFFWKRGLGFTWTIVLSCLPLGLRQRSWLFFSP